MTTEHETRIEGNSVTADLYVSASTGGSHERQRTTIAKLDALVSSGVLDEFDHHLWPGRVTTTDRDAWCTVARETYDEFASWARTEDRSLGPAFTRQRVSNEFSGQEYDVLRFPVLTLAIRADGEVVRVAPTGEDQQRYTVEDCIEELLSLADRPAPVPTPET